MIDTLPKQLPLQRNLEISQFGLDGVQSLPAWSQSCPFASVPLRLLLEAKEYKAAVQFFNDYGMSTEGLTRGEIKEVYRDITTKSFTYSKTAEVIRNSISSDNIGGYEIVQDNPTPEDIENLWNYKNYTGGFIGATQTGVHYKYHSEYKEDESLGLEDAR